MIAGAVTIDGSGTPSGSGLSREVYDVMAAAFGLGAIVPPSAPAAQQQVADLANAIAQATVAHITANAEVTVLSGIPVSTTGTAAAQTGATTSPGSGTVA